MLICDSYQFILARHAASWHILNPTLAVNLTSLGEVILITLSNTIIHLENKEKYFQRLPFSFESQISFRLFHLFFC